MLKTRCSNSQLIEMSESEAKKRKQVVNQFLRFLEKKKYLIGWYRNGRLLAITSAETRVLVDEFVSSEAR